jgi:hypothetical protein
LAYLASSGGSQWQREAEWGPVAELPVSGEATWPPLRTNL